MPDATSEKKELSFSGDKGLAVLLKYPVIVLSILAGMVLARFWLGIDFTRITEVGPGGIKLEQHQADILEAIDTLELRLEEHIQRIGANETTAATSEDGEPPVHRDEPLVPVDEGPLPAEAPGGAADDMAAQRYYSVTQTVSDQTAKLARSVRRTQDTLAKGKIGYIWIGNYDFKTKTWQSRYLARPETGVPDERPPGAYLPGTDFVTVDNLRISDAPIRERTKVSAYTTRSLGVIPKGTNVRIVEGPSRGNNASGPQWARVEVLQ